MITYEYLCVVENKEFEAQHSIMTKLDDCPLCKAAGRVAHAPQRLISGGSGRGIVELTGHEKDAKFKEDVQKLKKEMHSSEKVYSNMVGDTKYQAAQQRIDNTKKLFRRK